ncbi:MAG: serine--tRNA ligase [Candidatus Fermentibacteraceae bacterium]|nr:serine--tRNA ligase [Candidatus Fermentibacteraceae bacterium]
MLDRKLLRKEPQTVADAAAAKNEKIDIQQWLDADRSKRELMLEIEALRKQRNTLSKAVSMKKRNGEDAEEEMQKSRKTGTELASLEKRVSEFNSRLSEMELRFPNIPDSDVPVGTEENNVIVRSWGTIPEFRFQPKPHWDLMAGVFLPEAAGKIAGSNFILFRGWAAKLQRTLISWMLDYHAQSGMDEVWAPFVARPESMTATAQLPKMDDDMYRIGHDDLYLVPTGEVPLTNLYRDRLLEESDLPVRLCGYTPCFRREAGSYGKDNRGLNRVHQFEKVEMVRLEHPDRSEKAHLELLNHAAGMLEVLGIPYRILLLATGDLSFAAAKCYDIEIWSAGQEKWLEVSSVSNFRDFQARRSNMKYKPAGGGKPRLVHTLNGSGLALPRLIISLVENGQQPDGSILLPDVIAKRMGMDVIRPV